MDEEQDSVWTGDGIHTASCPYCGELDCWCHTDVEYHDQVQHPAYSDEDVERACSFYNIYY